MHELQLTAYLTSNNILLVRDDPLSEILYSLFAPRLSVLRHSHVQYSIPQRRQSVGQPFGRSLRRIAEPTTIARRVDIRDSGQTYLELCWRGQQKHARQKRVSTRRPLVRRVRQGGAVRSVLGAFTATRRGGARERARRPAWRSGERASPLRRAGGGNGARDPPHAVDKWSGESRPRPPVFYTRTVTYY